MIDITHILAQKECEDLKIRGLLGKKDPQAPQLRLIVDEIFYATQGGPFNTRTLAVRVEKDTPLTEKILTICNAPYYSGKTPIKNILQSIQRLGPTGFHCITMQAYLELDIFVSDGPWKETLLQIRNFSISVAHIARIISRMTNLHGDTAFLCGLLHRIGIAISIASFPDPNEDPILSTKLWSAIELVHPILSNLIAKQWGMDEEVQQALHHYGQIYANGKVNHLTAIIIIAEHLSKQIGLAIQPPIRRKPGHFHSHPQNTLKEACQCLSLDDSDIQKIMKETKMVFNSLQAAT